MMGISPLMVGFGFAALWGLGALAWMLLQAMAVRPPAPFFWLLPSGFCACTTWVVVQNQQPELLPPALFAIAGLLVLSAFGLGMANTIRGGAHGRWTWLHTIPAFGWMILAGSTAWFALETAGVAVLGALAIGLASLRWGKGADGRRLATTRVMVVALSMASMVFLAVAHVTQHFVRQTDIWSTVPWERQQAALEALPNAWALLGVDVGAATILAAVGFVAVLPVRRALLQARSSAGFVVSVLLLAAGASALTVPIGQLLEARAPNPVGDRRAALAKLGIDLPTGKPTGPWAPGLHVSIGTYWATTNGERSLPYRAGRPSPDDEGRALASHLATKQKLVIEADVQTDYRRLGDMLTRARDAGKSEACLAIRTEAGFGCLNVALDGEDDLSVHLLVQTNGLVWINANGEANPVELDALTKDERPVVHVHDDVPVSRLYDILQRLPPPVVHL